MLNEDQITRITEAFKQLDADSQKEVLKRLAQVMQDQKPQKEEEEEAEPVAASLDYSTQHLLKLATGQNEQTKNDEAAVNRLVGLIDPSRKG